jgi:hypothetical protein
MSMRAEDAVHHRLIAEDLADIVTKVSACGPSRCDAS